MMKIPIKNIFRFEDTPFTGIRQYKENLLKFILLFISTFAIPAMVFAVVEYLIFNKDTEGILYIVFFLPVIAASFFRKFLNYKTMVYLVALSGYLIGTLIILNEGFFGASYPIYLTIIAVVAILLGYRQAIGLLFICLATMVAASILFTRGILVVQDEIKNSSNSIISWIPILVSFPYLAGIITYVIVRTYNKMMFNIEVINKQAGRLTHSNKELLEIKNNLEQLVKKRTEELEEKAKALEETNLELTEKNKELENYNQLFVGREFRIKELKDKIKELEKQLGTG